MHSSVWPKRSCLGVGVGGFLQPPHVPPLHPGEHPLVVEGNSGLGLPDTLKGERSAGALVKFFWGVGLS